MVRAMGFLGIAVLCFLPDPLWAAALQPAPDSSLWACVTAATMSLVYFKRSQ
jgi:hypothetical protein